VTKDRTGSVISVLRTELHIKRIDLHMHFGITDIVVTMHVHRRRVTLDSDKSKGDATLGADAYPTDAVCSPTTLSDTANAAVSGDALCTLSRHYRLHTRC